MPPIKEAAKPAATAAAAAAESKGARLTDPFEERNAGLLTPLMWMTTALAAVASTVVAGSQLSSIGALSWDEDSGRLMAAVISIGVTLACVVLAIWLLTWAQMPGKTIDLTVLDSLGTSSDPIDRTVVETVGRDSSYHRGTGGLTALLTTLSTSRTEYYTVSRQSYELKVQDAAEGNAQARPALQQDIARATRLRELHRVQMENYRIGAQATSFLRSHLLTQHRVRRARTLVIASSVVAALAIVTFSWAANPSDGSGDEDADAIAPQPVAATLHLSSTDPVWASRIGEACAGAARTGLGLPVIATASDDAGVSIITVPSESCPVPAEVTVPLGEGTVHASEVAIPGS